jgi:hypothetical protein
VEHLRRARDPLEELAQAAGPPGAADTAKALVAVLLRMSQGELAAAEEALAAAAEQHPGERVLPLLETAVHAAAGADEAGVAPQEEPWLAEPDPEPAPRPVRLGLPPSWFEGCEDPVNAHPLFRRSLPELRLRPGPALPGVVVETDFGLEPDGYRIEVLGEIVESGSSPAGLLYGTAETMRLLGVQGDARPHEPLGEAVEPDAARDAGALGRLALMTVFDAIARRIAVHASAQSTRIEASAAD